MHCNRLVHYEIPWNPNRLEQRNGRIDRHGQPSPEVLIHHFVSKGYEDAAPGSLEGDLEWNYQRERAEEAIRRLRGLTGISNQVKLRPRVAPMEIKHKIEEARERLMKKDKRAPKA